jgi:hypothetical protein
MIKVRKSLRKLTTLSICLTLKDKKFTESLRKSQLILKPICQSEMYNLYKEDMVTVIQLLEC